MDTQSHELEGRGSIQIMNLLRTVNSNQLSVFMTRPELVPSHGGGGSLVDRRPRQEQAMKIPTYDHHFPTR